LLVAGASLEKIRPLLPAGSLQEARSKYEYAQILSLRGEFETADSLIRVALQQIDVLGQKNTLSYLRGSELLGRNFIQVYENDSAIVVYKRAIEHWTKAKLPPHWQLGVIYQGLQAAYYQKAQLQSSLRAAEQGMAVFTQTASPFFPGMLTLQRVRADVLIYLRDMEAAASVIEWLKKTAAAGYGKQSDYYAVALQKEASYLAGLGHTEQALLATQESADIRRALHAPVTQQVVADDLVADILVELERFDEARIIQQGILDSLLALPKRNKHLEGHAWEGLGAAETDPLKAIPLFENAVAHFRESFKRQDCGIDAYVMIQMAGKYLEAGQAEEAIRTLDVLHPDTSFSGEWDENLRDYCCLKGIACLKTGRKTDALNTWKQLVHTQCALTASELLLGTEYQRLAQIKSLQHLADLTLTQAILPDADTGMVALALQLQLYLKSLLLATSEHIRQAVEASDDPLLRADFEHLTAQREHLVWCYTQSKADLADQNIAISAVEHQVDSLEQTIARRTADFTLTRLRQPTDWRDIQAQLGPDEVALEIARFQWEEVKNTDSLLYAVFLIKPGLREPIVLSLPDAAHLEDFLLENYLDQCATPGGKGQTQTWYTAFWQQLAPHVAGMSTIYTSNDGVFHKVNLGAILLPDGTYVVDHFDIRPVFSLKEIRLGNTPRKIEKGQRTAFLAGNPTFQLGKTPEIAQMRAVTDSPEPSTPTDDLRAGILSATRGLKLEPLPGSQMEVAELATLLQGKGWKTTLVTASEATENKVKALQHPAIVHLATHGYFLSNPRSGATGMSRSLLENNPMLRSMLFFAGAQQTLDQKGHVSTLEDGILTAYEAQHMDLLGTELVVLSACQTAQGKVQNGEGVYGLQRALRIAGAQSLLLSLWDVDDTVGREFMLLFYKKWLSGASKSAAFRAAKLAVKAKYPSPFYWAGWLLVE